MVCPCTRPSPLSAARESPLAAPFLPFFDQLSSLPQLTLSLQCSADQVHYRLPAITLFWVDGPTFLEGQATLMEAGATPLEAPPGDAATSWYSTPDTRELWRARIGPHLIHATRTLSTSRVALGLARLYGLTLYFPEGPWPVLRSSIARPTETYEALARVLVTFELTPPTREEEVFAQLLLDRLGRTTQPQFRDDPIIRFATLLGPEPTFVHDLAAIATTLTQ